MTHEQPQPLKKCPVDKAEHGSRLYFMLAGGRIEFQSKGDGSTMRLLANPDGMDHERISHNFLTEDDFLENFCDHAHTCIEQYAAETDSDNKLVIQARELANEAVKQKNQEMDKLEVLRGQYDEAIGFIAGLFSGWETMLDNCDKDNKMLQQKAIYDNILKVSKVMAPKSVTVALNERETDAR